MKTTMEKTARTKRKTYPLFIGSIAAIAMLPMLIGCSVLPSMTDTTEEIQGSSQTKTGPVTVGSHLTVQNTDERLTLLDNMDALSADGLYYASWVSGEPTPYENSDGDTVDLYDAQLYLLLGESKSSEAARENMETWLDAGRTNYDVSAEENIDCNGQSYLVITYDVKNPDNPYARGISAFGVYENTAICVELTCQENYTQDLEGMLTDFLDGCTYQ